ncbi:MAG: iron-containing alcohol dehydrogenase [Acidimicrobiales bacterium]
MTDALAGRSLSRATRDALDIGRGRLSEAVRQLEPGFTVVTQPGPLAALDEDQLARAGKILEAVSLDKSALASLVAAAPRGPTVLGIGGGVVMDSAKWLAVATASPLVLAPSILSVDACVTNTVAVREHGDVTYQGFVEADRIVLDVDLVRTAPDRLNRAGVGDLLSIHTALWDWAAGDQVGIATFDRAVAQRAAAVLESVEASADEIAQVTDEALRTVLVGYADINDMTVICGHAQMEEGSEHYLAYLLERLTGKSFVHGEVVTLGTVLMSRLQRNNPSLVEGVADRSGVEWRPAQIGLSRRDLTNALGGLKSYVEQAGLPFSVASQRSLDQAAIDELLDGVV